MVKNWYSIPGMFLFIQFPNCFIARKLILSPGLMFIPFKIKISIVNRVLALKYINIKHMLFDNLIKWHSEW